MGRHSKARALAVWMNGERVGEWRVSAQGQHAFAYAPEWLSSPLARPLSLSMPLRASAPYTQAVVENYFENLLPDSEAIRRAMASRFGAASTRPFELLAEVGRDCVGAVQLLPEEDGAPAVRSITATPLTPRDMEAMLERVGQKGFAASEDVDFRISLAGAQEKTALLRDQGRWWLPTGATPTTHILKLPLGDVAAVGVDFTLSVENEWLCARVLDALGIPAARSEMAQFRGQRALVVERFDRRRSADGRWILRLPQEDFCQVTGTPSSLKYERDGGPGIEVLMRTLQGSSSAQEDRADLFRTLVAYWLLCAVDGHAKNFSVFLEAGGGFRLTPRYDVLSAYPVLGHGRGLLAPQKLKMAMAVHGKNRHYRWDELRRSHWLETGRRCGLPVAGEPLLDALLAQVPAALARVEKQLPRSFPDVVAGPVLDGLRRLARRVEA